MELTIQSLGGDFQARLNEAIFSALTEEAREKLLKYALESVLQKSSGWGNRSPLQVAFDTAISNYANKVVAEHLENDKAWQDSIAALVQEAWLKLQGEEFRSKMIGEIAESIRKGITGDRY
jgi:hypothetical protein